MLYVLHGEDEFSRSEQLTEWKARLGDPVTASLNTCVLDGRRVTLADLIEACDTLPFMGKRRLVVVEGFWSRFEPPRMGPAKGRQRKMSAADTALVSGLREYLPTMPDTTRLVFVEDRALGRANPAVSMLSKDKERVLVREYRPPSERDLGRWIKQRFAAKEGALTREAAQELASLVGANLRQLDQELEKLLAHANFERTVTREDVYSLVADRHMVSVFDLVDAIGLRQGDRATGCLHGLLDAGAAPLYLLHMIQRQFRILLQVKEMRSQGAGVGEIQSELGIRHRFVVEKALRQASRFSLARLESIFVHLAGLEQAIKTGRIADLLALDVLVAESCLASE